MKVSEIKKMTYPINSKPCIFNQYISFKTDKESKDG